VIDGNGEIVNTLLQKVIFCFKLECCHKAFQIGAY
jgi:hypothetical protein